MVKNLLELINSEINNICESPDGVVIRDETNPDRPSYNELTKWTDLDAIVFGYVDNKIIVEESTTHVRAIIKAIKKNEIPIDLSDVENRDWPDETIKQHEIEDRISKKANKIRNNEMKYDGRLWTDKKIVSFWHYPESIMILYRILRDVEKEINEKIIDNNYKIEVYNQKGSAILIPIEEYDGSVHHKEVERKPHEMPVMQWMKRGGKKATPYHTQHKLSKMGKTPAKYKFYKEKGVAENKNEEKIYYHGRSKRRPYTGNYIFITDDISYAVMYSEDDTVHKYSVPENLKIFSIQNKEDINKISKFVDERNIEQVISDSGVGNEIDWAVIGYLSNDDFELPEDLLSHLGYDGVELKEREGIKSIYIFNQDDLNYLGVADARETITEDPDNIEFVDSDGDSTYVDWMEEDALVFGYIDNILLTEYSMPHFMLIEGGLNNNEIELPKDLQDEIEKIKANTYLTDNQKDSEIDQIYNRYSIDLRDEMEYDGRLWTMWKMISFWRYPENKSKLYSILQDIERKENLDIIDNNYRIEVRDEEGEYFVIPIEDYQGKYHKEIERKPHEMPDMKWRQMGGKKSIPYHTQYKLSKMGKIPAKYRFYKEKNVAEQIIYDEIRKLEESPDNILLPTGERFHCLDGDAYPFIVNRNDVGDVYVHKPRSYHGEFEYDLSKKENFGIGYKGRIWLDSKLISFWEYPKDKEELFKVLRGVEDGLENQLDKPINIVNDPDYRIEVYEDSIDDDSDVKIKKPKLIPLKDFAGEMYQPPQIDHLLGQTEKQRLKMTGERLPYNTLYKAKKMAAGTKSGSPAEYRFARDRGVAEEIVYDEIRKIAESNEKWVETDDDDYLKVMITKQPKYYEQIKDYSITSLKQELKRLKNELNNYRYGDAEYDDYYNKYYFVERFMAYKEKVKINELYNKLMNQPFLNGKIKDFDLDFEDGKRKFTIEVDTDIDLTVDLKFNDIHYYDHTNDIGKSQDVNKIIDPSEAILDSKDLKIVNLFVKLINLYYKQNFKLIKPVLTDSKPFEKPQFTNEDFKWMIGLGGDKYKIKEADVKVDLDDYYKVIYLSIVISDGNIWNDITYKYRVRLDDAFKPKSEDFQEYKTFTEYKDTHYINEDVYDEIRKAIMQINPESKIVNTLRSIPNY